MATMTFEMNEARKVDVGLNQKANPNVNDSMKKVANEAQAVQPRILIADDQPDGLEALRALLKGHGYGRELALSPAGIIEALSNTQFDLILMDLNYARDTTSGKEGLDLLTRLREATTAP